ncbi:MAG: protocatechuate 3,4-dioxygenase subunit alpha [Gammaproteobacteria bacterium]|nr:protocatechuate 3,4-dioxygenase subunit alpha [Gammaproteobacteria bacterium]
MKPVLPLTPSQTVGPYFTIGMSRSENEGRMPTPIGNEIIGEGESINIIGKVLDGENNVVPDALLEIHQADFSGSFTNSEFFGFARSHMGQGPEGGYLFKTIKPGVVSASEAPYISVIVYMRGLLTHTYTRIYFSDEKIANADDALLSQIEESRRKTLIAKRDDSDGGVTYKFYINMQGEQETVFFFL